MARAEMGERLREGAVEGLKGEVAAGAPSGAHGEAVAAGVLRTVLGEVVVGVVGGADETDAKAEEDVAGAVAGLGEAGVGAGPNRLGGGGGEEEVGDAEDAGEFEVRPVVEGIAEEFGDGVAPSEELGVVVGVAGDEAFGDAHGAHGAPLVVVAAEPGLGDVGEGAVLGDLLGGEVAVVVDDRAGLGILMVERAGLRRIEEEVGMDEGAHGEVWGLG